MVRVGDRATGYIPGAVPAKFVFVNQQAHQLGYRDCGMRVVQLDRNLFVEVFRLTARRPVHPEHVLK